MRRMNLQRDRLQQGPAATLQDRDIQLAVAGGQLQAQRGGRWRVQRALVAQQEHRRLLAAREQLQSAQRPELSLARGGLRQPADQGAEVGGAQRLLEGPEGLARCFRLHEQRAGEIDAGGGWPQGQLTELLLDAPGIGELSLLAPVLARCTQDARACVWVLPCNRTAPTALPALPYPPALAAAGVDLAHALFVQPETPRETFWTIEQSLRAAHLGALVGWLPHTSSSREGEFRAMRRLQLLASRQQAPVFLLRDVRALHAPSPAALRLQLAARDGELAVTILKRRGRPLLEPVALQVHPAHWRSAQVVAPAVETPAQPQPAGLLQQAALVAQRWSARAIFSH